MYRGSGAEERSVLVVTFEQQLLGMDVRSGGVLWEHRLSGNGSAELVEHARRLYVARGKRLLCVAYPGGELLFDVEIPGFSSERATMVIEDGRVFVAHGGEITGLDLDGRVLWHNGLEGRGIGNVALGFPGNLRQADR